MLRKIFIIIMPFLVFQTYTCGFQTESSEAPADISLEEAYLADSPELYEEYLLQWQQQIRPINPVEFGRLSDTERAVYKIYEAFYNPLNLYKYCTTGRCPEFGSNIYAGIDYVVIQNNIEYSLTDYEGRKSMSDFHPDVDLSIPVLYLSEAYLEELNEFLDSDLHPEDIQQRYEFLNTRLSVWPGHWFGWHFLTHPEISIIDLNHSLTSAVVHFRIIFEGGEARFSRIGTEWIMMESKLTWIE